MDSGHPLISKYFSDPTYLWLYTSPFHQTSKSHFTTFNKQGITKKLEQQLTLSVQQSPYGDQLQCDLIFLALEGLSFFDITGNIHQ
jgi:hypothetical protein